MTDIHDALGRVAAAATENADVIVDSSPITADDRTVTLGLQTSRGNVLIGGAENQRMFTIVYIRQWSAVEGFDPGELPPLPSVRELISERGLPAIDGEIKLIPIETERGDELLDGIRTERAIYPYDDSFGLKEYRRGIQRATEVGNNMMDDIAEAFDVSIQPEEGAESTHGVPTDGSNLRGIQ